MSFRIASTFSSKAALAANPWCIVLPSRSLPKNTSTSQALHCGSTTCAIGTESLLARCTKIAYQTARSFERATRATRAQLFGPVPQLAMAILCTTAKAQLPCRHILTTKLWSRVTVQWHQIVRSTFPLINWLKTNSKLHATDQGGQSFEGHTGKRLSGDLRYGKPSYFEIWTQKGVLLGICRSQVSLSVLSIPRVPPQSIRNNARQSTIADTMASLRTESSAALRQRYAAKGAFQLAAGHLLEYTIPHAPSCNAQTTLTHPALLLAMSLQGGSRY
jgi:hypothetical protein